MSAPIVAIDGPAGSGKSTTAREVARRLGWRHVDSGAFYRIAALLALREGLALDREADRARLRDRLARAGIDQTTVGDEVRTRLDGEDVTAALRSPPVTRIVARVADDSALRAVVNDNLCRRIGDDSAIVDGRDIGSVVFPDAMLKVYLEATLEERARRRAAESEPPERAADPAVLASYEANLSERDRADRARTSGPLVVAPDAVRIDTSALDLETQVARVVELARARSGQR